MSRIKPRYFCLICRIAFNNSTEFIKDRQEHISKGETKKQNGKSKAATN